MRFKFIVASIAVATSIAAGAVAGINSASATPMTGKASASVSTRHAYNAQPNLKAPMLSEDRYIDGHWTGPVTPPNLPNTSGQCVPGIDCE